MDIPGRADQVCQHGRIVACTGAYLDNGFALAESQRIEPVCMPTWLTDVDAPLWVYSHERILLDKSRVVSWRPDVAESRNIDRPWRWAGKTLALDGSERLFNPWIARSALGRHIAGKERSERD
jgi:hypothetical protein